MTQPPLLRSDQTLSAATAAEQYKQSDDDDPDAVVVIKKVAQAVVIHLQTSVESYERHLSSLHYHNMTFSSECAENVQKTNKAVFSAEMGRLGGYFRLLEFLWVLILRVLI